MLKRRILFIEDHEDTRELVTFVLEASGYSVTSATTVASALRLAPVDQFDLYLIDNWLPDASELESLTELPRYYSILLQRWILTKSMRFGPGPKATSRNHVHNQICYAR